MKLEQIIISAVVFGFLGVVLFPLFLALREFEKARRKEYEEEN